MTDFTKDPGLEPGVLVRLRARPDWGVGQVQSVDGARVTVNFEEAGKVVVDLRGAELDLVGPDPQDPRAVS